MKKFYIILSLLLTFSSLSAESIIIEKVIKLKETLRDEAFPEQGGAAFFKDKFLFTTDNGLFIVSDTKGKFLLKEKTQNQFIFEPVVNGDSYYLISTAAIEKRDINNKIIWNLKTKTPAASRPFFTENGKIFIQLQDNTIYYLDDTKGTVESNYTYYNENEISYIKLADPILSGDKVIFGFSNGLITYFTVKNNQLIPFYKFKTAGRSFYYTKKDFYDIFSFVNTPEGLLFSSGEEGGLMIKGKVNPIKEISNIRLKDIGKEVLGYGEHGIFIYDKNGKLLRNPLKTEGFIFDVTSDETNALATDSEGRLYILDSNFEKVKGKFKIPEGINGKIASLNGKFAFISNFGNLYIVSIR